MRDKNLASRYCSIRRDLEERGWVLSSRLFQLSTLLLHAIGNDHQEFASLKQECRETRAVIRQAQGDLRLHRYEHGC